MEVLFSFVKYAFLGFFGLLLLLVVLALLFGKRVSKRWEYEAEFCDMSGKEFGEFDFEMSKIEKDEPEYSFKATFKMRHEALQKGQMVHVYLEDRLVMQGHVKTAGRIFLRDKAVVSEIQDPQAGQVCRVVWGGIEQFRAPIRPD